MEVSAQNHPLRHCNCSLRFSAWYLCHQALIGLQEAVAVTERSDLLSYLQIREQNTGIRDPCVVETQELRAPPHLPGALGCPSFLSCSFEVECSLI